MKRSRSSSLLPSSEKPTSAAPLLRDDTGGREVPTREGDDRRGVGWSSIDAVQKLIQQNEAEKRPKKHMTWSELLNHAWCVLGSSAAAVRASRSAVEPNDAVRDTWALLDECVTVHHSLPRSTSIAMVLHQWCEKGLVEEGVRLVDRLVACRSALPEAFATAFDERVATVACRLYAKNRSASQAQQSLTTLLQLLPNHAVKRRLFSPLLEHAVVQGDVAFARQVFDLAQTRGVELWDADYNQLFTVFVQAYESGLLPHEQAVIYAEEVLCVMAVQQPIVGARNADLLRRLLGGDVSEVSFEQGQCQRCGQQLCSYDLSAEDRSALLDDIVTQLIRPRMAQMSDIGGTQTVSSGMTQDKTSPKDELAARDALFAAFERQLADLQYDAVIDGANVGYYGLSSWYQEAKDDLLRSRGEDLATVPLAARTQVPVPVDVPPKFTLIEAMRQAVVRKGRRPIVVLHERHLQSPPAENAAVLANWRAADALLPSPHFLNDDFCWLYAAVIQPGTLIVTNDQMRDHHFNILRPRFFMRWRQRHRIGYKAMYHHASHTVTLSLRMPRPYSVWVQATALPAAAAAAIGVQRYWHVPFLAATPVLRQATNQPDAPSCAVELNKDGDDECTAWLCTLNQHAASIAADGHA